MNIIIVGLGKVGVKLTERLSKEDNINVTVVDTRREIIQTVVNTYDVMGVAGSGTSIDVLEEANVKKADVLIAATNSVICQVKSSQQARHMTHPRCQNMLSTLQHSSTVSTPLAELKVLTANLQKQDLHFVWQQNMLLQTA